MQAQSSLHDVLATYEYALIVTVRLVTTSVNSSAAMSGDWPGTEVSEDVNL
jgi:hypothetical protein